MNITTIEVANALCRYFETLYDFNRNLVALCGVDAVYNGGYYEKFLESVIHATPRLIPYTFNKSTGRYDVDAKDGLLEFSAEIPFIASDYKYILKQHYELLVKIKKIRNKFEHRMHGARVVASGSGSLSLFDAKYETDGVEMELTAYELIAFAKDINRVFSKIQNMVSCFIYEQQKEDYSYYRRLIRYDFCNFNQIFECNLLRVIGESLHPFYMNCSI